MGPYFETWKHQTLVRFAKEAYEKLQHQEEELQRLRLLTRREWVGLTDEEKLHLEIMGGKSDVMLAEAIEAKLRRRTHEPMS